MFYFRQVFAIRFPERIREETVLLRPRSLPSPAPVYVNKNSPISRFYVIGDESIVSYGYQSEISRENRFTMVCREQRSNCDVAFFDVGQLEQIENA